LSQSQKASTGVIWAGASQAGRLLIQILALAVLSRLLPAADFGLLALATVVTTYASLLRDMGTAAAIIQRDRLTGELLNTVFWFNVCVGVALAALVCVLAIPIANLFRQPRLSGVLAALAITFPLVSAGAVHQALLERSLRFRSLARLEISSALLALGVACLSAVKGFGVYSLVVNTIAAAALTSLQLWIASGWRPMLRWSGTELRSLWSFSANLFGFQTLNYFARNADTMLIGRFLGAAELGWYNMGYRIMLFPLVNLSAVMSRSLFPVLARQQSDQASFAALYKRTISAIAVVTAPLMAGLWVLREPFVEVVFGKRWLPVAPLLAWLAPLGLVQSLLTTVGMIYMATGKTALMMKWTVVSSVTIVVAVAIGLTWGYLGVAKAYVAANLLLLYPVFVVPARLIELSFMDIVKSVQLQVLTAILMAAFLWSLTVVVGHSLSPALDLAAFGLIGAITYVALGCLLMKSKLLDVVRVVLRSER
jgi:O-antigen/teichoic acid export membrane protein